MKFIKVYYTPNQILACFVLNLQIVNTLIWKMMYVSYNKELKKVLKFK